MCSSDLTKKGVPFRDAYKATGTLVARCIELDTTLDALPIEEYKVVSEKFEEDIYQAIDLMACVAERRSHGGPAPEIVSHEIEEMEDGIGKSSEEQNADSVESAKEAAEKSGSTNGFIGYEGADKDKGVFKLKEWQLEALTGEGEWG